MALLFETRKKKIKDRSTRQNIPRVFCVNFFSLSSKSIAVLDRGEEEGQPRQFLVRATFSSFSRLCSLQILVLPILFFKSVQSSKIKQFLRIGPSQGINEIFNFTKSKKNCFDCIKVFEFYVLKNVHPGANNSETIEL